MARIGPAGPARFASFGSTRFVDLLGEAEARAAAHRDLAVAATDDAADVLACSVPESASASSSASTGLKAEAVPLS